MDGARPPAHPGSGAQPPWAVAPIATAWVLTIPVAALAAATLFTVASQLVG